MPRAYFFSARAFKQFATKPLFEVQEKEVVARCKVRTVGGWYRSSQNLLIIFLVQAAVLGQSAWCCGLVGGLHQRRTVPCC